MQYKIIKTNPRLEGYQADDVPTGFMYDIMTMARLRNAKPEEIPKIFLAIPNPTKTMKELALRRCPPEQVWDLLIAMGAKTLELKVVPFQ